MNPQITETQRTIYWLAGLSCMIFIVYTLATIILMAWLGTPPESAEECFIMLNQNKLEGLLRLDILTVFIIPLYYLLFLGIYYALKETNKGLVLLSTLLVFVGVTLFLASPSVFSYLHLSEQYADALTDAERLIYIAAGEAIIASDIWHGTGAQIGGILVQAGAVIISFLMLPGKIFNKLTAYTGIITHGLDLLHILIGFFLPAAGAVIMMVAGPLYFLWFPLVGIRLFKLSRRSRLL
jgi:hypothetical protein